MDWRQTLRQYLDHDIGGLGIEVMVVLVLLGIAIFFYALGWLVRSLLEKRLQRLDSEARFSVERMAQLVIWVIGLLTALWWISRELEDIESLVAYPIFTIRDTTITPGSIVLFGMVLLLTLYASKLAGRAGEFGPLQRLEHGPRYTVLRLSQYLVWVLGILLGLNVVGIDLTALAVVAGALGLGIGFGLQNVVANFVAGLVLLFERPIRVDDFVSTENVEGRIQEIRFRSTVIQTNDNISMIVPNSELTSRALINWSHLDPKVRVHVPVGVAYGSDVPKVKKALLEVAVASENVMDDPEPIVWFTGFGDSSLNFELLVWTADPVRHRRLKSELNFAIDDAFRKYEIQIPFPQRDLHVRSAEGLRGLLEKPSEESGEPEELEPGPEPDETSSPPGPSE